MRRILTLLVSLLALSQLGGSAGVSLTGDGPPYGMCQFNTSTGIAPADGTCFPTSLGIATACTIIQTSGCIVPAPVYESISCATANLADTGWVAGDEYPLELIETRLRPGIANTTAVIHNFTTKTNSGCTNDDTTICVESNKSWRIPVNKVGNATGTEPVLVQIRTGTRTDPLADNAFRFWCKVRMRW